MPNCILRDCNNYTGTIKKSSEGITYHKFPRHGQEGREIWIEFVKKNREEEFWLPSDHSTICSKHFREQDFYETPKGRRFLKKCAIPHENALLDPPRKIKPKKVLAKVSDGKALLYAKNTKLKQQKQFLRNRNRKLKDIVKRLRAKLSTETLLNKEYKLLHEVTALETYIKSFKRNRQCSNNILTCSPSVRKLKNPVKYSPAAAYKIPIETFNNTLPHLPTLSSLYGSFKAHPGFTEVAFIVLDHKSSVTAAEKPLLCSLVFNEMAIRQQSLLQNKNLGLVNYGTGPQEENATEILVFMLVSLTESWKIPVGYFLAADISAEVKVKLIKICLEKCHEVGVRVVSLTFEGCEANYRAVKTLGCDLADPENMKTYFPHPCTLENVYIFIDPSHVLKLIRNTFENKRMFFDENKNKVKWQLLVNLNKLQKNESLKFTNKPSSTTLIEFRNQVMKIKLATQFLSMSITEALELCGKVLKSTQFLDITGTTYFITLMNNLFDVLNSQRYHFYGYKSHICSGNKANIFEFLNKVKTYILLLQIQAKQITTVKMPNGDPRIFMKILKKRVLDSQILTGFDCAIICIESVKKLFCELVEEKKLIKCISTHRLSQEHLELFFGSIRKHCGNNDNPDVSQFRAAYKKILIHLKLRSSIKNYAIPLDNFSILTPSSVYIINSTSSTDRYDNDEFKSLPSDNTLLASDVQASINCEILAEKLNYENLIIDSKLIVGYISGYVVRKIMLELKCEECINNLLVNTRLWHHKLITIKDMGGLCYSSENVFKVCVKTDAFIRSIIKENGELNVPTQYYNINYIVTKTLETFINSDIFRAMRFHSMEQPGTFNHRVHLIRALIEKYATIRLQYEADSDPDASTFMKCQKLRKLILFELNTGIN